MKRILVVEDSQAMRGLIASIVSAMEGIEVQEASSGFEALKQLPRSVFSLIITDINMPDINGLELISYIRKNMLYRETPVLVVSTEASEKDKEKAIALGGNAYITKPFEADDLRAAVASLLGGDDE